MRNFFKTITGFKPFDYQVKVANLLLGGKNVILSVPTSEMN
jgi:CRISPR-associated endonuclease/helicase Cas3